MSVPGSSPGVSAQPPGESITAAEWDAHYWDAFTDARLEDHSEAVATAMAEAQTEEQFGQRPADVAPAAASEPSSPREGGSAREGASEAHSAAEPLEEEDYGDERHELAMVIHDGGCQCRGHTLGWTIRSRDSLQLADAVLAAGFRRAAEDPGDGER